MLVEGKAMNKAVLKMTTYLPVRTRLAFWPMTLN